MSMSFQLWRIPKLSEKKENKNKDVEEVQFIDVGARTTWQKIGDSKATMKIDTISFGFFFFGVMHSTLSARSKEVNERKIAR